MVIEMSYKIILDSCGELPEEYKADERFEIVPLGLAVGDYQIMDDENFNQKEFLAKVAACPTCPKSSCPSPERYMEAYHCDADHVYVVTLSSKLSGSYNSAVLGKNLYHETYGKKDIYICDSHSARLSRVKSLVATTLSIKPLMEGQQGEIVQRGQAIGIKKGLARMADTLVKEAVHTEEKKLMITHCNCPDRAELVKNMILKGMKVRDVLIMDTAGISSMYANDGGVIVTL